MIIGSATPYCTAPVAHNACRIPTEADELWIIAVRTAPTTIPRTGLEKAVIALAKDGLSARPATEPLMVSIPNMRMAKPIRMPPTSLRLDSLLPLIISTMPTAASTGEKEEGFKSFNQSVSPWMPVKDSNHDVMVVPILAPIIIPTAWESFIMPELTKPTTITVVAEEDWITAVTPAPRSTANNFLAVSFSKTPSSLPPAILDKLFPIMLMPYRNNANPPTIFNKLKMSIQYLNIWPLTGNL